MYLASSGGLFECGTSDARLGKENASRANSLSFFFSFLLESWWGVTVPLTLVYLIPLIRSQLTALALTCTFLHLFFLLSIPMFVKRTRTWHGGNPQPTGPSGPPSSAFCSKIIPPPPAHRPPPTAHHPPPSSPESLCRCQQWRRRSQSLGWPLGLRGCQTAMSLSANAQPAREAAQPQLAPSCSR